jgi:hypothetical protein
MMLSNKNVIAHLGMVGLGAGILWGLAPSPVQANDRSVLCSNRQMTTQVALVEVIWIKALAVMCQQNIITWVNPVVQRKH